MAFNKAGDRIKSTATWKSGKDIWRLRTAKAFIKTAVKEARQVGNEDIHKLLEAIQLLDGVIGNQIDLRSDKEKKTKGGGV